MLGLDWLGGLLGRFFAGSVWGVFTEKKKKRKKKRVVTKLLGEWLLKVH